MFYFPYPKSYKEYEMRWMLSQLSVLKLLIVIAFIRVLEAPVLGKMIAAAWKV